MTQVYQQRDSDQGRYHDTLDGECPACPGTLYLVTSERTDAPGVWETDVTCGTCRYSLTTNGVAWHSSREAALSRIVKYRAS